jgi:hypothetical protein
VPAKYICNSYSAAEGRFHHKAASKEVRLVGGVAGCVLAFDGIIKVTVRGNERRGPRFERSSFVIYFPGRCRNE